jgi:DNA ligase (NAD+)
MSRISQLEQQIRSANHAYAQGKPYLTDSEYHQLWRELRSLDPENPVLFHTSANPNNPNKVIHSQTVLSLNKAFDTRDLQIFLQRFKDLSTFELQPKLDGVALMLYFTPSGWQAVLAGDGKEGDDISWILNHVKEVPTYKNQSIISCEAIIQWEDWDSSLGANPRNVVSGLLNPSRKGIPEALSRVSLVDHNEILTYETLENEEQAQELLLKAFHDWSQLFPCDGVVIKVPDERRRLSAGHNNLYPHWAVAWKPPIQTAETTVREIHWNVSRSGRVIPQIEYEPVELCGTVNQFATGNNAEWTLMRAITKGSVIVVGKAGEIIPQILEVKSGHDTKAHDPSNPGFCPACGSSLEWSGVDLVCRGPECKPQIIKRLSHFYGFFGMDVKGIGESVIEELMENPEIYETLKEYPWALLDAESFQLSRELLSGLGHTRYQNLVDSVDQTSGQKNPAHFISALGYPKLGYKNALALLQEVKHGKADSKGKISAEAKDNFQLAMIDLAKALKQLRNFSLAPIPSPAEITFCITGALPLPRNEIIQELSSYGWKHVNSVSKNLDYLVLGELERETTKLRKAKELGIKILESDELPIFNQEA